MKIRSVTVRCKAIGISNYSIKTTTELLESGTKVFPCLNHSVVLSQNRGRDQSMKHQ